MRRLPLVRPVENASCTITGRQPNGDIYLVDIFEDTKNKVIGNHHEANNQGYGA